MLLFTKIKMPFHASALHLHPEATTFAIRKILLLSNFWLNQGPMFSASIFSESTLYPMNKGLQGFFCSNLSHIPERVICVSVTI